MIVELGLLILAALVVLGIAADFLRVRRASELRRQGYHSWQGHVLFRDPAMVVYHRIR